ncbi:hypothetical protein ACVBIO_21105 [Shewanella sp. 0m-8]
MKYGNRNIRNVKKTFESEISSLIKINSPEEFKQALLIKMRDPLFKSSLVYNKHKFKGFGFGGSSGRTFSDDKLEHLLTIVAIKIKREAEVLSNYSSLKLLYENSILKGEYNDALKTVEEVYSKFGCSFWYLEAKLSTLSLMGDKDGFVGFYNLVSNSKITEVEIRDLDLIFDRTSSKSKVDRITYTLDSLKDGLSVGDALDSYIIDFMHRFNCGVTYNPVKVLSYFWQCNIIDLFNSVTRLLYTGSFDFNCLSDSIREDYRGLSLIIKDLKLGNYFSHASEYNEVVKKDYFDVCDLYIKGDYESCRSFYESFFLDYLNIFSLYEFYINSIINLRSSTQVLSGGVFNKIVNSSLSYESVKVNGLEKLFYTLNHMDILQVFSLREEKRIVNFDRARIDRIYKYFESASFPANPFNKDNVYEDSISSMLSNSNLDSPINYPIPDYRNKKRVADFHFHDKSFSDAIEIYLSIKDAPEHMVDEINNKIILCYFHNNEIFNACQFICDLYFNGGLNIDRVDSKKILQVIENCEPPEELAIEIPIAVYLISSKVKEEQIASLYLDDYLDFLDITRPSELEPSDYKHVFLMQKVCNLNVLESLHTVRGIYASSSERLLDRISILSKLNQNDLDVIREVKFLTTHYSRNLCVKDIGKGKLNINFDVLSEIIKSEKLNYIDSMITTYLEDRSNFSFELEEIKEQQNTSLYNSVYEFLCAVRDVYSLDGKYGLDYQLNTKIRHNGIVPAIRSIFDSEEILCKSYNDSYIDNELFERDCKQLLREEYYIEYQNKIKSLSKHIDIRLSKLKSVYMQIMTNDKIDEERLFKFPITDDDVASYLMFLNEERTVDEYVNHGLNLLKSKTNKCLVVGKALLATGLYNDFLVELTGLKSSLKSISVHNYKSSLSLVINDLENKMIDISEWLSFSEVVGENFDLHVAIYEAENFIKTIFPKVDININISDVDCHVYNGKHLDSFVHMFILLFENAAKKRKYKGKLDLNIDIANIEGESIKISIANLYSEVDASTICEINSKINSPEYLYNANKEKDSGLYKVKKILEIEFNCSNEILLNCEKGVFTFTASLDTSNLRV